MEAMKWKEDEIRLKKQIYTSMELKRIATEGKSTAKCVLCHKMIVARVEGI